MMKVKSRPQTTKVGSENYSGMKIPCCENDVRVQPPSPAIRAMQNVRNDIIRALQAAKRRPLQHSQF